jgi:hypothetical protein
VSTFILFGLLFLPSYGCRGGGGGAAQHISIGPGPEKEVHQKILERVLEDDSVWRACGPFMIPMSLHTLDERVAATFHAYGALIAIYIVVMGEGPSSVSPFLLIGLMKGLSLHVFDINTIAHFCNETAQELLPWHNMLDAGEDLPDSAAHPVSQLVITRLDKEVGESNFRLAAAPYSYLKVRNIRRQMFSDPDEVTRDLQHAALFGESNYGFSDTIRAFSKGFHLDVNGAFSLMMVCVLCAFV